MLSQAFVNQCTKNFSKESSIPGETLLVAKWVRDGHTEYRYACYQGVGARKRLTKLRWLNYEAANGTFTEGEVEDVDSKVSLYDQRHKIKDFCSCQWKKEEDATDSWFW
jgi:hypothetical protein